MVTQIENSIVILKLSNKKWRVNSVHLSDLYWCWNTFPQVLQDVFPVRLYEAFRNARVFRSRKEAEEYAFSIKDNDENDIIDITAYDTWENIVRKSIILIDIEITYVKYLHNGNNKQIFLQDLIQIKRYLMKEFRKSVK